MPPHAPRGPRRSRRFDLYQGLLAVAPHLRIAPRQGIAPRLGLARQLAAWALAVALCTAGGASAQTFRSAEPGTTPGWVFTPTFVFSGAYDNNVTLAGRGSPSESDTLSILTPAADVQWRGRHNWVGFGYDGSWSLYRQLNELNSYDQGLRLDSKHDLSRRVSLLLHDGFSIHPTTDVVELEGVPFLRTGSRMNDGRAELRVLLTPHTTARASYSTEWVGFAKNLEFARFLHGGIAHGVAAGIQRQLSSRLSIGADYSFHRLVISDNAGRFDIQDAAGSFSYLATPSLTLSGSLGVARLTDDAGNLASRTGPSWRAAIQQRFERATIDVAYLRSYVPSYGIGGTIQNEEFDASLHMPLARNRIYWQGTFSWRRNEPIDVGEQTLKSLWFQNWVGYAIRRWLRIEGYYWRSHQNSQLPGGIVDRHRLGIQMVTAMPMRLQ